MYFFTCKCLNITLESDKTEDNVDCKTYELSSVEQRDIFFSEKLLLCPSNSLKCIVSQEALIGQRLLGQWTIQTCLACGQNTHAVSPQSNPNTTLVQKSLLTSAENLTNLKNSTSFSPIFNILVPEVTSDIEMKENMNTNNILMNGTKVWPSPQQSIGSLSKQLKQKLQTELEAVEESVRQYRDLKYAEYEAYKERAQRDHTMLTSIISKTRGNIDHDGWHMDTSIDNGPLSPQLPPLQRRRLSSIKDAKKITQFKQSHKPIIPPEEDSLEAEDLFDMEGDSRHDMGSDQDDYDSDNSGSHDEGIHISRGRPAALPAEMARSLPINMPNIAMQRHDNRELNDNEEETHDIAASIKALAKSVHGDVYELPRPRFSTQI